MTDKKDKPESDVERIQRTLKEMGIEATDVRTPEKRKPVEIGSRIELYGGYDNSPGYLKNPSAQSRTGTVIDFIKSERGDLSAVVKLDTTIVGDSISGNIAVLSTRNKGQDWTSDGPVHIELCNFIPKSNENGKRQLGEWIEAAASYRLLEK